MTPVLILSTFLSHTNFKLGVQAMVLPKKPLTQKEELHNVKYFALLNVKVV